jgi:hypothetical protein
MKDEEEWRGSSFKGTLLLKELLLTHPSSFRLHPFLLWPNNSNSK